MRIWKEDAREIWRGHITEMITGTHQYFADPGEIAAFVRSLAARWRTDDNGTDAHDV